MHATFAASVSVLVVGRIRATSTVAGGTAKDALGAAGVALVFMIWAVGAATSVAGGTAVDAFAHKGGGGKGGVVCRYQGSGRSG